LYRYNKLRVTIIYKKTSSTIRIIFPNVKQLTHHAYCYRQWHGRFASKVINRVASIFPKVMRSFRVDRRPRCNAVRNCASSN